MHRDDLSSALAELERNHLLRKPDDELLRQRMAEKWGERFLDAASNDYLGLARKNVSRETVTRWQGSAAGSGASRLVFGTHPEHVALEREVADWLGYPAALLFSSGYAANLGTLGCLVSPGDAVFSDRLNHASLIDGIRLSGARAHVFSHLDWGELEMGLQHARDAAARWVVVESYYSMDGDGPDFLQLRELCDRYDAGLVVDEAHSLGVFGPEGKGALAEADVQADVLIAAFGKAVGGQGACVLGSEDLRTWLWNRARSFVFSTAPSPVLARLVTDQVRRCRRAEEPRRELLLRCERVRERLGQAGLPHLPGSRGPILSLLLEEERLALAFAEELRNTGVLCQAIRPPTVPVGAARVRLTLHADWTRDEEQHFCERVIRAWEHRGSRPTESG